MSSSVRDVSRVEAVKRALELERGPRRTLVVATLINTVGTGLFITGGALYFTRALELPAVQVGTGLTIAGVVGLVAGIPAGKVADRFGPRQTWASTLVIEAVGMFGFLFVRSFASFVLVACVTQLAAAASQGARLPMVRRIGGDTATRLRAYLRSVVNVGASLGALAAGLAIQVDTDVSYSLLIAGNAASFASCAVVVLTLPRLEPLPVPDPRSLDPGRRPGQRHRPGLAPARHVSTRRSALRDRPFLAVTMLNGILSIQDSVLTFALPLWIVGYTDAPRWVVAATILLNTVLVTLFQVSAARGVDSPMAAGRAARSSAYFLLVGFVLMGAASHVPGTVAVVVLLCAIVHHTVGEIRSAAASFELSFGLAPAHAQGEYGGLFGMGSGIVNASGPLVLGLLLLGSGTGGWIALGAVMVLCGLTLPPVVRWAERTPPRALKAAEVHLSGIPGSRIEEL